MNNIRERSSLINGVRKDAHAVKNKLDELHFVGLSTKQIFREIKAFRIS